MSIQETEQWLLEGNCNKCRRVKHCTKSCKPHKNYMERSIKNLILKTMVDTMSKKKG